MEKISMKKKMTDLIFRLMTITSVALIMGHIEAQTPIIPGEMITIPAGNFLMGSPGIGIESPQHSVYLPTYQIGKYEVTRGEYRIFIIAGGYNKKDYWSDDGWKWKEKEKRQEPKYWAPVQDWGSGKFTQTDNHPVIGISCFEAEAYCKWAGCRLPTEEEWEKAARWDEQKQHPNIYPWGDIYDVEMCNNIEDSNASGGGYKKLQTSPVGSYPADKSPYGCMDMAGNATEWCDGWFKGYPGNSYTYDHTNKERPLKGGSGFFGPSHSSGRGYNSLGAFWLFDGFRVVLPSSNIAVENQTKEADKWIYTGEMVDIPAGSFLMGNSGVGDDVPYKSLTWEFTQHRVALSAYKIGKYEVTRGQYRKFIESGAYKDSKYWSKTGWAWLQDNTWRVEPGWWNSVQSLGKGEFTQTDDFPVMGIMHYEAEAYCKWAGGRLPTEEEWEKAARWDEKKQHANIYPWGDSYNPVDVGSHSSIDAVGSNHLDKSPYGCMDMAGNVSEWCADWMKSYPDCPQPFDYTNSQRALRGWFGNSMDSNYGRYFRCANRNCGEMDLAYAIPNNGFRIAR